GQRPRRPRRGQLQGLLDPAAGDRGRAFLQIERRRPVEVVLDAHHGAGHGRAPWKGRETGGVVVVRVGVPALAGLGPSPVKAGTPAPTASAYAPGSSPLPAAGRPRPPRRPRPTGPGKTSPGAGPLPSPAGVA